MRTSDVRPNLRPSLLSGAIGGLAWLRNPSHAWRTEHEQWRLFQSYRQIAKLGVLSALERRPNDAIPPKYNDLSGLYRVVMQRRPEIILELGGGCSTFVLARAAHDLNARGFASRLYTVDQSHYWQSAVRDVMPENLRERVAYHCSDVRRDTANGIDVWRYDSLPVAAANFAYVDGGQGPVDAIWADAWFLEQDALGDYAFQIDGRQHTVAFLKQQLARRYSITPGLRGTQTLFVPAS